MPYKEPYKDWPEDRKLRHQEVWRNYYYRNHDRLKQEYLGKWHKKYATPEGKKTIVETNRRAKANQRFGVKDRNMILERFKYRCVFCLGEDSKMTIHHLDNNGRRTNNPNNSLDNLVTCCHSCHALIHFHNKELQMKI